MSNRMITIQADYHEYRKRLLSNPTVGYWVKNQLLSLEARDPIDAMRDAELLLEAMRQRCYYLTSDVD